MITNVKMELDIDSGDAAMVDDPEQTLKALLRSADSWVARLLADAEVNDPGVNVPLRDVNGNRVGTLSMRVETDE